MDGVFVTGIDTSVGKTTVCAGLLKMIHGSRKVAYWKPVQTGTIVGDDTNDIRTAVAVSDENFLEPTYRFAEPVSPYYAAKKWGKHIDLATIVQQYESAKKTGNFLIVEGAGGLLVPYNANALQIDLIKALKLPLIIVATDRIGAINQTLLTVNECRAQKVDILGIIVTKSRGNLGNSEGISHFSKVEILAEFPPLEDSMSTIAQVAGNERLRKLFNIPILPA
jgi:dethiobiotin synthetase